MEKILFTDLDGTVLDCGVLSSENKETLTKVSDNNIEIVVSTGKGLSRVDEYFKDGGADQMILENGAKIQSDFSKSELSIRSKNYKELLELLNGIKNNIEFLFFYDSKNDNRACFYINYDFGISDVYEEKFKNILDCSDIYDLKDLNKNILKNFHGMGMLNIKTTANSNEELGLGNDNDNFNIVFNEGMLNIGVSNKGVAINQVLRQFNKVIDRILVAGNDKNDLPMIDEVIKLTKETCTNVGVIIVGNLLEKEKAEYKKNSKIEVIDIDSPNNIYIGIQEFFSI